MLQKFIGYPLSDAKEMYSKSFTLYNELGKMSESNAVISDEKMLRTALPSQSI